MENTPYTSETIKLYKEMFEDYNQIGIVIQAYLLRSLDDVKSAEVEITFDPPWTQDLMSEEAKLELGML